MECSGRRRLQLLELHRRDGPARLQFDGINGATLGTSGFPGGDIHVFSATVDPIVHLDAPEPFRSLRHRRRRPLSLVSAILGATGRVSPFSDRLFPAVIPIPNSGTRIR
jgi:hypothetical protein